MTNGRPAVFDEVEDTQHLFVQWTAETRGWLLIISLHSIKAKHATVTAQSTCL